MYTCMKIDDRRRAMERTIKRSKFSFKLVRCNPDVAPRLTSGGYEDKVDVIIPINILFIGGGDF